MRRRFAKNPYKNFQLFFLSLSRCFVKKRGCYSIKPSPMQSTASANAANAVFIMSCCTSHRCKSYAEPNSAQSNNTKHKKENAPCQTFRHPILSYCLESQLDNQHLQYVSDSLSYQYCRDSAPTQAGRASSTLKFSCRNTTTAEENKLTLPLRHSYFAHFGLLSISSNAALSMVDSRYSITSSPTWLSTINN